MTGLFVRLQLQQTIKLNTATFFSGWFLLNNDKASRFSEAKLDESFGGDDWNQEQNRENEEHGSICIQGAQAKW